MKKSIYTLLAILAVTILPGCGKSDNGNGVAGVGVYGGSVFSGGANGQGCYNLNQFYYANPNAPFQGTFAGQGQVYGSTVQAVMYGSQTGMPGASFVHSNSAGDSLQLYVSGSQAISLVTLAPSTVAAIVYYGGGQLCGVYTNSNTTAGTGNLQYGSALLGGNGSYIYAGGYALTI